jgi:hypothetical protein
MIKLSRFACGVCLFLAVLCLVSAPEAQKGSAASNAGNITGLVGLYLKGGRYFLSGWAFQQGQNESIRVHVYTDHSAYGPSLMNRGMLKRVQDATASRAARSSKRQRWQPEK